MNRVGRLVLTRVVLTATVIYLLIEVDLPKWVIRAINVEDFYGKDRKRLMEEIAWQPGKMFRALLYGRLGIHNLEYFGWTLCIRWLWAQKTDPSIPWAGLTIQVPQKAQALFHMAVDAIVGNGETIILVRSLDKWQQCGRNTSQPL